MVYIFEANGQMAAVALAYKIGITEGKKIAEFTGIKLICVDDCMKWLRKSNFDPDLARKKRNQYARRRKQMKRTDNLLALAAE